MTLAEQRAQLVKDLRLIEDGHERMAVVVDRGRSLPPLSSLERVTGNLVPGCVSAVHLVAEEEGGRCRFRIDSGSALIKGLAGCYCELYSGRSPAEILGDPDGLIEELGLERLITSNRLIGVNRVRIVMHNFARSVMAGVSADREES